MGTEILNKRIFLHVRVIVANLLMRYSHVTFSQIYDCAQFVRDALKDKGYDVQDDVADVYIKELGRAERGQYIVGRDFVILAEDSSPIRLDFHAFSAELPVLQAIDNYIKEH